VKVNSVEWLADRQLLVYFFDNRALLYYGAGVLPGTDVPTYRFVHSHGYGGSREAYKEGQGLAAEYSRGFGYNGAQGHFESFWVTQFVASELEGFIVQDHKGAPLEAVWVFTEETQAGVPTAIAHHPAGLSFRHLGRGHTSFGLQGSHASLWGPDIDVRDDPRVCP
jgi:hypothetical protein